MAAQRPDRSSAKGIHVSEPWWRPGGSSGRRWPRAWRPPATPWAELLDRLHHEVRLIVASREPLQPFYLQRGFHGGGSWPPDVQQGKTEPAVVADSNAFWFDPGELVLTLSSAYPYLPPDLQGETRAYLEAEMSRFPPLQALPFPPASWLAQGRSRESYTVPDRAGLSTW